MLLTVPADSLSDHLLAHNVEESDHQQLVLDSEGTKNDYGSLKVCGSYWCITHVCVSVCCCIIAYVQRLSVTLVSNHLH